MTISRTVRFPLKLKLLAVMLILITASLTIFVGIALTSFRQDKSAYIFESMLSKASSGETILAHQLSGAGNNQRLQVKDKNLLIGNSPAAKVLEKFMEEDSLYVHSLIIPEQQDFYRWHEGKLHKISDEERKIFAPIITNSVHEGVKEAEVAGEKWIIAYHYNPSLNFAYAVSIPKEEAFAVTRYLINKSLFYGLFILGAAMILSVLLARPLTAQLETLYGLTQEIAGGNFQKRVKIKSEDEVGALSESVNHMADKIVVYMEEMKEKARLENEVAVGQLVQSSFFPPPSHKDQVVQIHGHFEPASECGGDWWGIFEHDEWKVLFIADATGHGVPAALLTATINCCKLSLGYIIESRPALLAEPHEILRYMNQAVSGSGKEIQVTCFVGSLNKKTLEFRYANASHTPPLLFSAGKDELKKDDFQPLIEVNGPRLGQSENSTYTSANLKLRSHDTLFFYTDGLTEAENAEGNRWGERRLIKALVQHGNNSAEDIINALLQELKDFAPHKPSDDITAVALKVLT